MYFQVLVFLFGLIIGSFLNVIIFRYDNDLSWKSLFGRSYCRSCRKKLNWYELIPVFSFLVQKGKCRKCGKQISFQYIVVEVLTAFIFLLIFKFKFLAEFNISNFSLFQLGNLFYLWIIFSILIIITVYDIRHKIIPDRLSFLFAGLSFFGLFLKGGDLGWVSLSSGLLLATPFAFLWLVSSGRWIGLGDAKLLLGIGWFLGLIDGISSVVIAFWIGAFVGIFLILLSKLQTLFFKHKTFTIRSEIPFAPFLIMGMLLVYFFGWDVLGLKMFLV